MSKELRSAFITTERMVLRHPRTPPRPLCPKNSRLGPGVAASAPANRRGATLPML